MELARVLKNYTKDIRLVSRKPKAIISDAQLVSADLLDAKETQKAIEGSRIVYITVGLPYSAKVWQEQWPKLMQNVIEASAKHHAKIVFLDNVYVYGKVDSWMREDTPFNPCSKKGEARAKTTQLLLDAIKSGNVEALIARSADFFGPKAYKSFAYPMIFERYQKGKSALWLIDKDKPHSMSYTKDIAKALALLGNTPDAYSQTWHLPTDSGAPTGEEFIKELAAASNIAPKMRVLKAWMLTLAGFFNPVIEETKELIYQYDSPYLFSSEKFESRFFAPTPYKKAILETLESM